MKNKKMIEIYTDGSSLGNPGPGGWGFVVVENDKITKEAGGFSKETTNNKMELQAVIEAIKYIKKENKINSVKIHVDSSYVLGGVTSWIFNWEKNGWKKADKKPVLNKEIWQELIALVRECDSEIFWEKIKGHSGHKFNDRADEVATTCATEQETL